MRQVQIVIVAMLAPLQLLIPLFCTMNLLTKSETIRLTKESVYILIDTELQPSFCPGLERGKAYGRAVMRLLEWADKSDWDDAAHDVREGRGRAMNFRNS